jgi:hypothetical protein
MDLSGAPFGDLHGLLAVTRSTEEGRIEENLGMHEFRGFSHD